MTTRVLLVDDHELIREGLARAFERDAGMSVIGQAGSVAEALSAWRALRPDVVTDLQLPDGSGLGIVRAVRSDSADVGLVMLTMHAADAQMLAAMEVGASAFLGKEARGTEVVAAAAHAVKASRLPVARVDGGGDASRVDRGGSPDSPGQGGPRAVGGRTRLGRDRRPALPGRVHGQDPRHADLPEARRQQPCPGVGGGDEHGTAAAQGPHRKRRSGPK